MATHDRIKWNQKRRQLAEMQDLGERLRHGPRPPAPTGPHRPPHKSKKIIIAGSRGFSDYKLLCRTMDCLTVNLNDPIIFSGGARGADRLGQRWAEWNWLRVEVFPADWTAHGKAAGPIRNREMADRADALVAFWDGESPGTENMIETARKLDLDVRVIPF